MPNYLAFGKEIGFLAWPPRATCPCQIPALAFFLVFWPFLAMVCFYFASIFLYLRKWPYYLQNESKH